MALNIGNPQTEDLAHQLANVTGESLTEAVTVALRERLAAIRRRDQRHRALEAVRDIQAMVAALPVRDHRAPDEILGYDVYGLPG